MGLLFVRQKKERILCYFLFDPRLEPYYAKIQPPKEAKIKVNY